MSILLLLVPLLHVALSLFRTRHIGSVSVVSIIIRLRLGNRTREPPVVFLVPRVGQGLGHEVAWGPWGWFVGVGSCSGPGIIRNFVARISPYVPILFPE